MITRRTAEAKVYNEILQRFPEISGKIRDYADLPYVLMGCIADWLKKLRPEELTPELIGRISAFAKWCEEQPEGKTASSDIYTIYIVGFFENLFDSDTSRVLLPKLFSKEDFVRNEKYLKTWIGEEDYNKALKQYDAEA